MSPEELKELKVLLAIHKFDILEEIENKVKELLKEKNRPRVEVGYR